jgi:hypothetical protein
MIGLLLVGCSSDDDPPTTLPNDITAPAVTLAASQDFFRTDAQLVLTATASDQKALASVTFFDGGTSLALDTESPFEFAIDLTQADNRVHSYTAVAEDAAGNTKQSDVVEVLVYIDAQVGFVNGGFELNADSWDHFHLTPPNGWTDEVGNPAGCMRLNESNTRGIDPGISQVVDGLMPGVSFTVSGEYRPYVNWIGSPTAESFVVTVDSVVVGSFARGPNGDDWSDFTIDFIATEETHAIGFWAEHLDDSSYELDNVVIDLAP